jgi:excisionase family DNA binding protein
MRNFKLKDYQEFKPQAFGTVVERKKLWSLQNELAERLGIPRQTVDLWARQKRIPFCGLGRLIKFEEEEVLAYFKVEADKDESFSKTTWETDRKLEERDDRSASRGRFEFHSYDRATPALQRLAKDKMTRGAMPERAGLLDCRSDVSRI